MAPAPAPLDLMKAGAAKPEPPQKVEIGLQQPPGKIEVVATAGSDLIKLVADTKSVLIQMRSFIASGAGAASKPGPGSLGETHTGQ